MADPDGDYDPQVLVDEAAERLLVCGSSLSIAPDDGGKLKCADSRFALRSALRHRLSPLGEKFPCRKFGISRRRRKLSSAGHSASGVEVTTTAIGSYTTDGSHVFILRSRRIAYMLPNDPEHNREKSCQSGRCHSTRRAWENGIYFINLSDEARIWYLSGYADDGGTVSAACLGDMPNCADQLLLRPTLFCSCRVVYLLLSGSGPCASRNAGSVIRANNREPVSTPLLIRVGFLPK